MLADVPLEPEEGESEFPHRRPHPPHWKKQFYNTTLPTLIGGNATLHIGEFKFGPFVKIGINGRPSGIFVNDILAFDGVIQATDRIILPRRRRCHKGHHGHHGHHGQEEQEEQEQQEQQEGWVEGFAEDEEWTIENLKKIFNEE